MSKFGLIIASLLFLGLILYVGWQEMIQQSIAAGQNVEGKIEKERPEEDRNEKPENQKSKDNNELPQEMTLGSSIVLFEVERKAEIPERNRNSSKMFFAFLVATSFTFHAAMITAKNRKFQQVPSRNPDKPGS